MLIIIAVGAFVVTFLGGLAALRFRDRLHLILGFSAGAVVAVAFFDLLPEALELGGSYLEPSAVMAIVAAGFFAYMVLDRTIFLHSHAHDHDGADALSAPEERHLRRGMLAVSSLSLHSFLDGVAIGLAFQVSSTVGAIVAVAVLVHDFSDGINTISLVTKNGGDRALALKWLAVDAVAPVVGVIVTMFFSVPDSALSIILALFCGFFLYIGATDLIPESHHRHPKMLTTAMTIAGAAIMYAAIQLANV